MFIYNITVKVDWRIHEKWLAWMRETEIPRMLASNYFTAHRMLRLLDVDDSEGPTYAIQYSTDKLQNYRAYIAKHAAVDNANTFALWGDGCVLFTTLMELVH